MQMVINHTARVEGAPLGPKAGDVQKLEVKNAREITHTGEKIAETGHVDGAYSSAITKTT